MLTGKPKNPDSKSLQLFCYTLELILKMYLKIPFHKKKQIDALECKRAVKWICDYIFYQCQRPPQAHSKDLHSTIVAAFQCSSAWLMQHPYLLQDKDCLTTVLEVVELGISGSKSVGKAGEPNKLKEEKELKPASIRVREAAETLLTIILEQV